LKTLSNILIHQLKQQPRIGRISDAEQKRQDKAAKQLAKDQQEATKALDTKLVPALEKYTKNLTAASNETSKLSAGVGQARQGFDTFSKSAQTAADSISAIFDANKDLNESFGMSSAGAYNFSKSLRDIDVSIGDEKLLKYAASLGKLTGGYITSTKADKDFKIELVKTQTFLQNNLKLSDEQAQKFELNAANLGRTGAESIGMIGKVAATFSKSLGMDQTQVLTQISSDIADMGADTVAQFGRIPGQLEQATMKARLLGVTMEDLSKSGETMLNIESSVGAEMEYQLLTGKRMLTQDGKSLTNAFRTAQLQGNGVKQAELMQQYLEDHGDELDNNFLARKKASEIFGIDAAKLMEMKGTLQLTKRLGVTKLVQDAQGDLDVLQAQLKAEGVSKDEIAKIIKSSDTRTPAAIAADKLTSLDKKITGDGQIDGGGAKAVREANAEINRTLSFAVDIQKSLSSPELLKTLGSIKLFADQLGVGKGVTAGGGDLIKGTTFKKTEGEALASGGYISGPGTGTSDSIPARLSDGEYVINAASTSRNRGLLDKINNAPVKMAAGGAVTSMAETNSLLRMIASNTAGGGNVMGETAMNGRKRI